MISSARAVEIGNSFGALGVDPMDPKYLFQSGPLIREAGDALASSPEDAAPQLTWALSEKSRRKYAALFDELSLGQSRLDGKSARLVLEKSGLPLKQLAHIWELSDVDRDGNLMKDEFILAMHLVSRVKQGLSVPDDLPVECRSIVISKMPILTKMPISTSPEAQVPSFGFSATRMAGSDSACVRSSHLIEKSIEGDKNYKSQLLREIERIEEQEREQASQLEKDMRSIAGLRAALSTKTSVKATLEDELMAALEELSNISKRKRLVSLEKLHAIGDQSALAVEATHLSSHLADLDSRISEESTIVSGLENDVGALNDQIKQLDIQRSNATASYNDELVKLQKEQAETTGLVAQIDTLRKDAESLRTHRQRLEDKMRLASSINRPYEGSVTADGREKDVVLPEKRGDRFETRSDGFDKRGDRFERGADRSPSASGTGNARAGQSTRSLGPQFFK